MHNQLFTASPEKKALNPGKTGEWFMFAIESKETRALIGDCAFNINETDPRQAELGVTLAKTSQKKGFAQETIQLLIKYIFKNSAVERVNMITYMENAACIELIKKLGLKKTNIELGYAGSQSDKELYGIKKSESMFSILKVAWQAKPNKKTDGNA